MGNSVTVIVPNYNQAHDFTRLVSAFMRQSLPPAEILVIDDGSTDDSVTRISELARTVPQIRLLINERNMGVVHSVNRGIREARGEFLSMYGCDDVPLQGYLEREVALLNRHPVAAVCVGNPLFWYEELREAKELRIAWSASETYLSADEAAFALRRPMFVHPGGGLVRRDRLLEIGGYDSALEAYCDWFAWLALIFRYGCCYVPATFQLCCIRQSSYLAQMNKNQDRAIRAANTAMRKVLFGDFQDVRQHFETSNAFSSLGEKVVRAFEADAEIREAGGHRLIHRALATWSENAHGIFRKSRERNWYVEADLTISQRFPLRTRLRHFNTALRIFVYHRLLPRSVRDRLRALIRRVEGRPMPAQNE
jgi:glycosyltransferase involved in cell wall biosynthesis